MLNDQIVFKVKYIIKHKRKLIVDYVENQVALTCIHEHASTDKYTLAILKQVASGKLPRELISVLCDEG